MTGKSLGYIFSRYPLITETFILREIAALGARGHRVVVAPLIRVRAAVRHRLSDDIDRQVCRFPALSAQVLRANWRMLRRAPRRYAQTLLTALCANATEMRLLAGVLAFWTRAVAIADEFERRGVEHIHAHFATHPAFAAWVAHRLTSIPYSFTAHAHDIYVQGAMLPRKVADAEFVVAISQFNREWILERCPNADPERIMVVHCGVPLERYLRLRNAGVALREGGEDRPLRILSIGALQPYKGHATLLEACAQLAPRMPFECRIVGDGPLRGTLERQIARLRLAGQVTLTGALTEEQVREQLAWGDVFVLASVREPSGKMEGIPVALMEAMAAGVPVIAARLSGIPELVEDGKTGLLATPGDVTEFACAVWRMRDPLLRRRLAGAGRARVEQGFDLNRSVNQLIDLFEQREVLTGAVA